MKKKEMEVRITLLEGALLDLVAYVALQGTEDEMRLDQLNVWRDRFQSIGRCSDDLSLIKVTSGKKGGKDKIEFEKR